MKTIANAFITFKAGRFGFATVCALNLTGGIYAKVAVDRFGNEQDEFCNNFNHPSEFHLWCEAKRQKPGANLPVAPKETGIVPATSTTNSSVLP